MAEPNSSTTFRTASWFVVLAVAAVLYLAQAVFIPLALALLLAFLLAPLIRFFERVGLRRTPAVAAIVLLSASVLAGVISLVVLQAVDLAEKLPNYRETMDMKFA
ncbi:MAG TPA: AI-2E family transporter, partial [Polyangiaceae bacterium]